MPDKETTVTSPPQTIYDGKAGTLVCTAHVTGNPSQGKVSGGGVQCTMTMSNGAGGSNYSSNKFRPR